MNLVNKFFGKENIECPRCLGKGGVDRNDIKRLGKELKWLPEKCAYCNGTGKVSLKMTERVKADKTYLTTDISKLAVIPHFSRTKIISRANEKIVNLKIKTNYNQLIFNINF